MSQTTIDQLTNPIQDDFEIPRLQQALKDAAIKFITDCINAYEGIDLIDNALLEDDDFDPDEHDDLPIFGDDGNEYRIYTLFKHPTYHKPFCTGFQSWPESDGDDTEEGMIINFSIDELCALAQYLFMNFKKS